MISEPVIVKIKKTSLTGVLNNDGARKFCVKRYTISVMTATAHRIIKRTLKKDFRLKWFGYFPLKSGFLFSMNALVPSFISSDENTSPNRFASKFNPSAKVISMPL